MSADRELTTGRKPRNNKEHVRGQGLTSTQLWVMGAFLGPRRTRRVIAEDLGVSYASLHQKKSVISDWGRWQPWPETQDVDAGMHRAAYKCGLDGLLDGLPSLPNLPDSLPADMGREKIRAAVDLVIIQGNTEADSRVSEFCAVVGVETSIQAAYLIGKTMRVAKERPGVFSDSN